MTIIKKMINYNTCITISTVVAVIQCLQVTVIILCKYIVSFHNSQQRRHVTVWHASQERALHTIYYCQISNIMC